MAGSLDEGAPTPGPVPGLLGVVQLQSLLRIIDIGVADTVAVLR